MRGMSRGIAGLGVLVVAGLLVSCTNSGAVTFDDIIGGDLNLGDLNVNVGGAGPHETDCWSAVVYLVADGVETRLGNTVELEAGKTYALRVRAEAATGPDGNQIVGISTEAGFEACAGVPRGTYTCRWTPSTGLSDATSVNVSLNLGAGASETNYVITLTGSDGNWTTRRFRVRGVTN